MKNRDILSRQNFLVFVGTVSLFSLLVAYVAQYIYAVNPCVLCLYERYFYWALVVIGIVGFNKRFANLVGFKLAGLILLCGSIMGIYHAGVELQWWQGTAACHGVAAKANTIEEFRALLRAKPMSRCDQPNWHILGISATYVNLIWFVGFTVLWDIVRRRNKC